MSSKPPKDKKFKDPLKPVVLGGRAPAGIPATPEAPGAIPPVASASREAKAPKPHRSVSTSRRDELTALLWGAAELDWDDSEDELPSIVPTLNSLPSLPKPKVAVEPASPTGARRSMFRRACSFPGLLRVLVPEQSFAPKMFAVRIIDLTPNGAQMETRQIKRDMSDAIRKDRRFARLEALLPGRERMILSGRVAWASYGPEMSRLGVEFERPYPEVMEAFVADISQDAEPESLCLGSPLIDPFPSITSKSSYMFSGYSPDGEEVLVRNGSMEFRCPVRSGRFKVEVMLMAERSNFLSFTAARGDVCSIPTPGCIAHQSGASDTMSYSGRRLVEELTLDPDARHLTLRLGGTAGKFFRVLKKIEESLEHAEEIEMAIELTGNAAKVAAILESLKKEC